MFIPFVGGEDILRPCLVSLSGNDNPALKSFKEFLESQR